MKGKKTSTKKTVKIKNALDKNALINTINNLSNEEVAKVIHDLCYFIGSWMGNPTRDRIKKMITYSFFNSVIDIEIIYSRLEKLDEFNDKGFGVHISKFMPELVKIKEHLFEKFDSLPSGTEKAELWLQPIATDAGADADVEAAIYFASRNKKEIIDANNLKKSWYETICNIIEEGSTPAKISKEVKKRAKSKTISLVEASEALKYIPRNSLLSFFSGYDQEEEFLDAAFFRAVEWFSITGFEPWLDSLANEMSRDLTEGVDYSQGIRWLFFWCRSDLAINRTEGIALETALWALMNGPVEKLKPWRQPLYLTQYINTDYISIAGILPFIWHRVNPSGLDYQVITKSLEFLFQTQMVSGGWPVTPSGSKPDIMPTCFAIHGLAMAKPNGWEQMCKEASEWLMTQQTKGGFWYVGGGPTVMITVLVLDSINLANNSDIVTFKRNKKINHLQEIGQSRGGLGQVDKKDITSKILFMDDENNALYFDKNNIAVLKPEEIKLIEYMRKQNVYELKQILTDHFKKELTEPYKHQKNINEIITKKTIKPTLEEKSKSISRGDRGLFDVYKASINKKCQPFGIGDLIVKHGVIKKAFKLSRNIEKKTLNLEHS